MRWSPKEFSKYNTYLSKNVKNKYIASRAQTVEYVNGSTLKGAEGCVLQHHFVVISCFGTFVTYVLLPNAEDEPTRDVLSTTSSAPGEGLAFDVNAVPLLHGHKKFGGVGGVVGGGWNGDVRALSRLTSSEPNHRPHTDHGTLVLGGDYKRWTGGPDYDTLVLRSDYKRWDWDETKYNTMFNKATVSREKDMEKLKQTQEATLYSANLELKCSDVSLAELWLTKFRAAAGVKHLDGSLVCAPTPALLRAKNFEEAAERDPKREAERDPTRVGEDIVEKEKKKNSGWVYRMLGGGKSRGGGTEGDELYAWERCWVRLTCALMVKVNRNRTWERESEAYGDAFSAAWNGDRDRLKHLLDRRKKALADPKLTDLMGRSLIGACTPSGLSFKFEHVMTSEPNFTTLHIAAQAGYVDVVQDLLDSGVVDTSSRDKTGQTALHKAGEERRGAKRRAEKARP